MSMQCGHARVDETIGAFNRAAHLFLINIGYVWTALNGGGTLFDQYSSPQDAVMIDEEGRAFNFTEIEPEPVCEIGNGVCVAPGDWI